MLHLLDADTLITGERDAYPIDRFPVLWDWIVHQGTANRIKVAREQFDEITTGKGMLADWLKLGEVKAALLFDEEVDPALVARVVYEGYAPDLTAAEIQRIGQDPFMIAHALRHPKQRRVVTFEVSKPSKKRANRKVPDACQAVGVTSCNLYRLIKDLDFSTGWSP